MDLASMLFPGDAAVGAGGAAMRTGDAAVRPEAPRGHAPGSRAQWRLWYPGGERVVLPAPEVTYERLLGATAEPHNWLTYSGSYDSWRHSGLDEITSANVGELELAWVMQTRTPNPKVETTPLVVDGIMYLTEPPSNVIAVDATTGRRLWTFEWRLPDDVPGCCGRVNRGVALLGNRLFIATMDAHLVALDARTGELLWDVVLADYRKGYSMTGAPLALEAMVVTGIAGGEYGIRGFLDAYDAATGERLWRFYTVPGPGDPGHQTWEGDSWKHGGAPTWITGSYDPGLDLLYWGVGNPGPPLDGTDRGGRNLYSNSVIALDPDNEELVWHFQFTPHDTHDWDATQIPVLVDLPFPPGGEAGAGPGAADPGSTGERRPLMLFANRNAFYYVLDRETGEFLHASPFAKQTWARGIDPETGLPIEVPGSDPTPEGTLVYPAVDGATNWWSPSYSPETGLLYVPAVTVGAHIYRNQFTAPEPEYEGGELFWGSVYQEAPDLVFETAILALVPQTGEIRWKFPLPADAGADHDMGGMVTMGGVLSTGGGLVFASGSGWFFALDAASGEEIWRFQTGGDIVAAPISYEDEGRQQVTVASGRAIYTFARPPARAH